MPTRSRDLRESVVRGLAKVGLVWALAVLGFVFTAGAAAGSSASASPSVQGADSHFSFVNAGEAPRTAGLALALTVLGGGITVLAIGSVRAPLAAPSQVEVPRLDEAGDLALPHGLALSPYAPA